MKNEIMGIIRANKRITTQDIPCNEVINLRSRDGKWKPIQTKVTDHTLAFPATAIVNHVLETGTNLVYYRADNGVIGYNSTTITNVGAGMDIDLQVMGTILIISNRTDLTTVYAIWSYDDAAYRYLSSLPDIPHIDFTDTLAVSSLPLESAASAAEAHANWTKVRAQLTEDNYLQGNFMLMWAWEMYDGTYIKPSSPQFLSIGFVEMLNWDFYAWPSTLSFIIRKTFGEITAIQTAYNGLIRGLTFFICSTIDKYATEWTANTGPGYLEVDLNTEATPEKVALQTIFYKVYSIELEKMGTGSVDMEFSGLSTLETLEAFPVDSFSHHTLMGQVTYIYNERILLGNIANSLYKGYDPRMLVDKGNGQQPGSAFNIRIAVTLATKYGTKTVLSDVGEVNFRKVATTDKCIAWKKIVSYPDSRATSMKLYVEDGANNWELWSTITLKSHPIQNFAYNAANSRTTYDNGTTASFPTVNDSFTDDNRVQASEILNPFVYPAANSYQVGSGEILGIISNSMPVSSGQFGEYPLIVFGKAGVWSLLIGTDGVFITNVVPMNPDVAYPSTIAQAGRMIVYGTKEGLKILSGAESIDISDPLEGEPGAYLDTDKDFKDVFINHPNLVEITERSTDDFLTYLVGACCSFDKLNEEIIVSNSPYGYSYLYSLKSKTWYKMTQAFDKFVNGFEKSYGLIIGTTTYIRDVSSESSSDIRVLIESNPLNFGADSFKKLDRLAIRGEFDVADTKRMGFYLYGSLDGIIYKLIGAKQAPKRFNDIILASGFSCKYFILVIAGEISSDSCIYFTEAQIREKLQNKLR